MPEPSGAVIVIVPVAVAHVGCINETVGAAGTGLAFSVALVPDDVHPPEFLTVTEYVPMATPEKIPVVLVYVEPSILYVNPEPVGAVTVIVPVDPPQDGCVNETVGAEGFGLAFNVAPVPDDVHPPELLAVTVYVPLETPEKMPVVFVYVDPLMLYVIPEPVGAVIVIVPVDAPQAGCVNETVGAAGTGLAFSVVLVPDDVHPSELLAVTVYVPRATPENIPVVFVYVEPSILYVIPEPVGAVIVIVPVDPPQDGCVNETVGAEGFGLALIVALVPDDVHPPEFLAVTVYVPLETPEKMPVVLVYVEPLMLYVIPEPVGAVIVIVPVETPHEG
jgi:hypothetical protein